MMRRRLWYYCGVCFVLPGVYLAKNKTLCNRKTKKTKNKNTPRLYLWRKSYLSDYFLTSDFIPDKIFFTQIRLQKCLNFTKKRCLKNVVNYSYSEINGKYYYNDSWILFMLFLKLYTASLPCTEIYWNALNVFVFYCMVVFILLWNMNKCVMLHD